MRRVSMENKQNNIFKIAALVMVAVFAMLFYMAYARSSRYIAITNGDDIGMVFDTKEKVYIFPWDDNIKDMEAIKERRQR